MSFKLFFRYDACYFANFNGLNLNSGSVPYENRATGIHWLKWRVSTHSLRATEMAIRPATETAAADA